MKVIFSGTPEFAIPTLDALLHSSHKIVAVFTRTDKPAGRGQKILPSPVKQFALNHQLLVCQPKTLKDPAVQKQFIDLQADALINVAYGLILPKAVLEATKFGCINLHPSLLPRWRGAAPLQRTILAGDSETGVTIMQMDEGLDTGGIFKQRSIPIADDETTATLAIKTADLGAKLLLEVLSDLENGTAKITPQDDSQMTYASKITKDEAKIDWQQDAKQIDRMIRAFNSWPIAYTTINGITVRIWRAVAIEFHPTTNPKMAGTILRASRDGLDVATNNGVLRILQLQLPGGKVLTVNDLLNAHRELFSENKCFTKIEVKNQPSAQNI